MKKRVFTIAIVLVALLLLAGVGYATWVISQSMEETSNGNIVVETVSNERLNVTVALADPSKDKFVFGHPSGTLSGWLTAKGADPEETLTVDFTVTITKQGNVTFGSADEVNLTPTFETVLVDEFMQNGQFTQVSKTLSADSYTITALCRATIQWGTLTDGKNPYTYFNGYEVDAEIGGALADAANHDFNLTSNQLSATSTYADYALAYLTYFNATFNAQQFQVKVAVNYN